MKTVENAKAGHTQVGQLMNVSMMSSIRGDITYHKLTSSMRQRKDLAFGVNPNKEPKAGNTLNLANSLYILYTFRYKLLVLIMLS